MAGSSTGCRERGASDYLDFLAFFRVLPSSRHHPGEHAFNVARSQVGAGAMECSRRRFYFLIKPGVVAAWIARTVVIVGPTDGPRRPPQLPPPVAGANSSTWREAKRKCVNYGARYRKGLLSAALP